MDPIPIYLKTDSTLSRPTDPLFYWLTRDGLFLCRNHPFFASDTPASRAAASLAGHAPGCEFRYPRVKQPLLEFIIAFFDKVYELHRAEAMVLLLWNLDQRRYKLWIPDQEATVWQSWYGTRSPMDVRYTIPLPLPARHLLVGDIHCHGNMPAYASHTDRQDERYRDGVHAIVGCIDREPPRFHLEMTIDGHRFPLQLEQVFEGYAERRGVVSSKCLAKVKVRLDGSTPFQPSQTGLIAAPGYRQPRRKNDWY